MDPPGPRNHLDPATHSQRTFVDGHGAEVDMWGVGFLIKSCNMLDVPSDLQSLAESMQNGGPTAKEAFQQIKDYKHRLYGTEE